MSHLFVIKYIFLLTNLIVLEGISYFSFGNTKMMERNFTLQNAAKEGKKYIVIFQTSDKYGCCYGNSKHNQFAKHSVMINSPLFS
jgi:hypothetical protein